MSRARFIAVALMIMLPAASAGVAAEIKPFVLGPASRLNFVAIQAGSPFSGTFDSFAASIRFSADDLANSSFDVRIAMQSVDTAYADRDEILRGAEFFDVAVHPEATFIASQFVALEAGAFAASGVLTIKGVARPLDLPFTFSRTPGKPGRWLLKGSVTINRLDFGVGTGDWRDAKWIGHEVKVSFELVLDSSAG